MMVLASTSNCVAIIPARGGSKRITRKNIKSFAGQPAINYAIAVAKQSGLFERIIVSTDDPEIEDVALQAGAEVPFRRPPEYSGDDVTTSSALKHALDEIGAAGKFDYVCCIYPVVPFLVPEDLKKGLALVKDEGVGCALAVSGYDAPIHRAFQMAVDGKLDMMWPENRDTSTSDLIEAVHDAGQFYWVPVERFMKEPVLLTADAHGVQLPRWRAHDVDTQEDWDRAQLIFEALMRQTNE